MIHALSTGTTVAYGPFLAAIPVAMLDGAVSFPTPCCLSQVPGYLANVRGAAGADATRESGVATRSTAVAGTALFVLGLAAVFTSYGALFGGLGRTLIRNQAVLIQLLGGAMLVILGVLEVTGIWGTWLASLRTLIGAWQVPQ